MKLYTEKQVLKIIQKSVMDKPETYYEVLKDYTPIELPSDDEIVNEGLRQKELIFSFMSGAKWIKEQILNQNK